MITFLDASNNNGVITPSIAHAIKVAGYLGVLLKTSEGTDFTDPDAPASAANLRAEGLLVGGYHFGHPASNHAAEAAHALAVWRSLSIKAGWLDEEVTDGVSPAGVGAHAQGFCAAVVAAGLRGGIYTGEWFWDPDTANTAWAAAYPLWVSSYTNNPLIPFPWKVWTFWQYTDSAAVSGGHFDASRFAGSLADFAALFGSAPAKAAMPAPTGKELPGWYFHQYQLNPVGHEMVGPDIKAMQIWLGETGVNLTSKYDGHTNQIVVVWQRNHGLTADGVLGPQTAHAMWLAGAR